MNEKLLDELRLNEIDVEGALDRLSGDKDLYMQILLAFPRDTTVFELEVALENKNWDDVFTAAHALKGLAANLGFAPLYHSIGELVIEVRTARIKEIYATFHKSKQHYNKIVSIINKNQRREIS